MENEEPQQPSGINFAGFVLSLATTAAVQFGDIPDPNTGERVEPNVQAAGQMIEILACCRKRRRATCSSPSPS